VNLNIKLAITRLTYVHPVPGLGAGLLKGDSHIGLDRPLLAW